MIPLFMWYLLLTGVLFALTLFAIVRTTSLRLVLSTGMFMLGLFLSYIGLFSLTGLPQPVWLMWNRPDVEDADVLGGFVEENVGIFVLLQAQELGPTPKYYWFPYSTKAAEALQGAQRKGQSRAQKGGDGRFMMRNPFERSLEDRPDDFFHDKPQPKMPDKTEGPATMIQVPTRP